MALQFCVQCDYCPMHTFMRCRIHVSQDMQLNVATSLDTRLYYADGSMWCQSLTVISLVICAWAMWVVLPVAGSGFDKSGTVAHM